MNEFHKPFIKSLVFIAACTIVSMILTPIFVSSWISIANKNQAFTTAKSENTTNTGKNESIRSVIE